VTLTWRVSRCYCRTPGATPGTFGTPQIIWGESDGAQAALFNRLIQVYASGATGYTLYTSIGMCV
jgi:hypothetical protein